MVITKDIQTVLTESLQNEGHAALPASEAEYLAIAETFPHKLEYHKAEIFTMGLSSYIHELLSANLIFILRGVFSESQDIAVLGSNSGVHLQKFEGGYYMPDVTVVKGEPHFVPNSAAIITNPYIIIEVLSPSTQQFDLAAKLPEYKQIESLHQIIFVQQQRPEVMSFTRTDRPNQWLNEDFYTLNDSLLIESQPIPLSEIYQKINFQTA